jgi:hypothetical protein
MKNFLSTISIAGTLADQVAWALFASSAVTLIKL